MRRLMRLASRALRVGESATMRVSRRALALRASGIDVVDLSAGEPEFDSPRVAVEAACHGLETGFTRYTAAAGLPDLRNALAMKYGNLYGAPWSGEENVIVTVGAKAALFELALALFEPGDEVIVPTPAWVSFIDQIRLAGAEPVEVPCRERDDFKVPIDAVANAIGGKTKAVILNSPSNPTGAVVESAELRRLAELCASHDVVLVADETYERFVYEGAQFSSAAALAAEFPDHVAVVSSFSKSYAMTGWRVGYLLGPAELVRAVLAIQSHATSNPTSFAMLGALAVVENEPADDWLEDYALRRQLLVTGLDALPGVRCRLPAGGFYAFANVEGLLRSDLDTVELAEWLLDEARVAAIPGAAFGSPSHLRFSFACSLEVLEEGLRRLRLSLRRGAVA